MLKRILHTAQTVVTEPIEAEGTEIEMHKTVKAPFKGLHVYGRSTQDGTPTLENPVEIVSVGDSGSIDVNITGAQLCSDDYITLTESWMKEGKVYIGDNSSYRPIWVIIPGDFKAGEAFTISCNVIKENEKYYMNIADANNQGNNSRNTSMRKKGIASATFTLDADTDRLICSVSGTSPTSGILRISDIMVNKGSIALSWESYKQPQTMVISAPDGLPGIPVSSRGNYTDSEGQQWVCDEIDFSRGKYVQRTVKEVFDETASVPLVRTKENGEHWFNLLAKYKNLEGGKAICDRLPYDGSLRGNSFRIVGSEPSTLRISVEASELPENPTADDVKNWLKEHPLTFISPLYEPIETPLSEEALAAYKELTTYYPTTIITNSDDAYMKVNCLKILGGG